MPAPKGNPVSPGSIGRNAIYGPGSWNTNLTLARSFTVRDRVRFQVRADAFDVFNHANPGGISTEITAAAFGKVTSLTFRTMQLGARMTF